MKLNYSIFNKNESNEDNGSVANGFKPKNRTKLSMQQTVMSSLASNQPVNPASAVTPQAQNSGWGSTAH